MGRFRRWVKEIFGSDSDYLPGRIHRSFKKTLERDPNYIPGEYRGDLRARPERRTTKSGQQRYLEKEADHELLRQERAYVKNWTNKSNKKSSDKDLTGIALSGGGIRSATFSLGVLQALARHDVLQYIDYVSTVSGGGYIGLGLTWWLAGKSGSKETYGVDSTTFPYGIDDPARPPDNQTPILAHLRDNAAI